MPPPWLTSSNCVRHAYVTVAAVTQSSGFHQKPTGENRRRPPAVKGVLAAGGRPFQREGTILPRRHARGVALVILHISALYPPSA
jgi:hypothetical protein